MLEVVETLPDSKIPQTQRMQDGKKCVAGKLSVAKVGQGESFGLK